LRIEEEEEAEEMRTCVAEREGGWESYFFKKNILTIFFSFFSS
jgi:hypothetical protein